MKSGWLAIVGLILLLGIAVSWRLIPQETSGAVTPVAASIEEVAELDVELGLTELPVWEFEVEADEEAIAEFTRRYLHVPDTRRVRDDNAPSTDERDITAENVDSLLLANLDYALEGDMASAYFVTRTRMNCERFASTPEELKSSIKRVNRRVEHAGKRGRSLPATPEYDQPWSYSSDSEANRAHMKNWYGACERVRSIFTADLRLRLEMLARQGNVMARYVYATWPEELLHAGEAFDGQFRWEDQAREFSLANLHAGEVAGLMAFGHSYHGGSFTARDNNLALSFGVAALHCGFETISVRSYLASSIEKLTSSEKPVDQQRLQFILTESDRLGRFCAS